MGTKDRILKLEQYDKLREECWEDIAATVVEDFAKIFLEVNQISNPEQRLEAWVRRCDEVIIHEWTVRFGYRDFSAE